MEAQLPTNTCCFCRETFRGYGNNPSGDANAQAMVSSALLGSWAATNVPKSSLPADLARLVAASVLKSMLADAVVS